jgi:hypothetical protein
MDFTSEQALRDDIATLSAEIVSLTVKRDALNHALMVIAGERIIAGETPLQPLAPEEVQETQRKPKKSAYKKGHKFPPGQFTPYSASELRDVVVSLEGEFNLRKLAELTGRNYTTLKKYLDELIERNIVIDLGGTGGRGRPHLYKYNTDFPPSPNNHPHEPTPESQAVGSTLAGGKVETNGHIKVADTMIQGFINAAYKQGWTVTWKDGNHLKFVSPDGKSVGVNACPPRRQVAMVIKRDLKRSGLNLA